ncbi:hypothetical protein LCGC14_1025400 [marine sediment metagenome]|uniref:Uncharacterized protein n=1 Tax=marine sediment metagenome TaxID=412755 RepID=A0A0F9N0R9_9ZZZZ
MDEIKLVFRPPDLPPTLNGKKGLLRIHWSKRERIKKKFMWLIKMQKTPKISSKVNLVLFNYAVHLMDWDNLAGRLKIVGDAMVGLGLLEDDSPEFIVDFDMKQEKVHKMKDVRIEFIFTKV